MKILPVVLFFFLFSAGTVLATTHNYVCADFNTYTSSSCTADVFTIGNEVYSTNAYTTGNLTAGEWLVSATITGGTVDMACHGNRCTVNPPINDQSGNLVEYSITATDRSEFYIFWVSGSPVISNLMIETPPEDPPEPESTLFGSSTATTTVTLGDVSMGIAIIIVLLFLFVVAYIWNTITDKAKKPWR